MKRTLCRGIALVFLITAFVFLSVGAADKAFGASKKYVIRAGHTNPPDQSPGVELLKYKEIVEKRAPGKIEIRIYHNSSLGKGKELLEGVQMNTVEMALLISQPPALDPKDVRKN